MTFLKGTISPSEVITVFNGGPPANADQEMARRGVAAHRQIVSQIEAGQPPAVLRCAGVSGGFPSSKTFKREITPGLTLSTRPDYAGVDGRIIEIKPGELKARQVVQVGLTRVASGQEGDDVIFLYQHGRACVIDGGTACVTPQLINIATNARRILDIQQTLHDKPSIKGAARDALGAESVRRRNEMDADLRAVMDTVKPRMKIIG